MAHQASTALKASNVRSLSADPGPHEGLPVREIPSPADSGSASDGPSSGPVAVVASAHRSLDDDWPTLAVLSRRYIDRALEHTGGNKTRAADLLGIDRRTLNRILARERARNAAAAAAAVNAVVQADAR